MEMNLYVAKKMIAILLVFGLLLGGCQTASMPEARMSANSDEPAEVPALPPGEKLASSFNDTRLPGMIGLAQNEALQLFIQEETAEIAVIHKQSGQIWRSNPEERNLDTLAAGINKDLLSSQAKLSFYNSLGQSGSVNSYTDSVAHQQISYEALPNGVRVNYQFGSNESSIEDLPVKISKERFEQKLLAALDKAGQRALKVGYAEDKDEGIYIRIDKAMQGLQLTRALKAFETAGYTPEDLQLDNAEHGIEQEKVDHACLCYPSNTGWMTKHWSYACRHLAFIFRNNTQSTAYPCWIISVLVQRMMKAPCLYPMVQERSFISIMARFNIPPISRTCMDRT